MSKKDKLIQKIKNVPNDFTYQELIQLLGYFGYQEMDSGKTSGSSVKFVNKRTGRKIYLHKPHPGNVVKKYILREIISVLEKEMD